MELYYISITHILFVLLFSFIYLFCWSSEVVFVLYQKPLQSDDFKCDEFKHDDFKHDDFKRADFKSDDFKCDDFKRDDFKCDDF